MIRNLLVGIGIPPQIVGIARAVIHAAASAAIGALVVQLEILDWGQYAPWSPVVFAALRALEGFLDRFFGKTN